MVMSSVIESPHVEGDVGRHARNAAHLGEPDERAATDTLFASYR